MWVHRQLENIRLPDWFLVSTQSFAYLLGALPVRWYFKVKKVRPAHPDRFRSGTLIIANHQAETDPFVSLACLPFPVFVRLLPIHFPTTEKVFRSWKYNPPFFPFVWLLGCFSIGATAERRMHSVFYIRELLKQNRTVFIFPEGKINYTINVEHFKRGVDFFMPSAHSVLFIRLQGMSRSTRDQGEQPAVTFGALLSPPPTLSGEEIEMYLTTLSS